MKSSTILLLLGGGGLLAYVGMKASEAKDHEGPAPGPIPPPPGEPPLALPAKLATLDAMRDGGSALHLRAGQYYKGRLDASMPMPPFSADADAETLKKGLVGFTDLTVHALPPVGWEREVTRIARPTTRWFYGKWNMPTMDLPRPPNLELLWVAASPELVASRA